MNLQQYLIVNLISIKELFTKYEPTVRKILFSPDKNNENNIYKMKCNATITIVSENCSF